MNFWNYIFLANLAIICPSIVIFLYSCFRRFQLKKLLRFSIKSPASCGLTGYEIARQILDSNTLTDLLVESNPKNRNYFSSTKDTKGRIYLYSVDIFDTCSIHALAVTAHECGHAIIFNHCPSKSSLKISPKLLVFTMLLMAPLFFYPHPIIALVSALSGAAILAFRLLEEFNATSCGLRMLRQNQLIQANETYFVKKYLFSNFLTYVASTSLTIAAWNLLIIVCIIETFGFPQLFNILVTLLPG